MARYPNSQVNPNAAVPVWVAAAPPTDVVPPTPFPATIAAGVTYDTGAILNARQNSISAAATLSQAGTLTVTTYIDAAGTIPLATANTVLVAATPGSASLVNPGPWKSFRVQIKNTSGALGNLTNAAIING